MKKSALILAVAAVAGLAGSSFAQTPTPGMKPNDNKPNENANIVGEQSSAVTKNGVVVREQARTGTRGDLIKALQAQERASK